MKCQAFPFDALISFAVLIRKSERMEWKKGKEKVSMESHVEKRNEEMELRKHLVHDTPSTAAASGRAVARGGPTPAPAPTNRPELERGDASRKD